MGSEKVKGGEYENFFRAEIRAEEQREEQREEQTAEFSGKYWDLTTSALTQPQKARYFRFWE